MAAVDHLMSVVPDLESAAIALTALGFTVTPRSEHSGLGTANRLVVFPPRYWELVAVQMPLPVNAPLRRDGLVGLALASADAEHDREHAAFGSDTAIDFTRSVMIDGLDQDARFRIARLHAPAELETYVFLCEHQTPELVWREEWMKHANGASALSGMTISYGKSGNAALRALLSLPATMPRHATEQFRLADDPENHSSEAARLTGIEVGVPSLRRLREMLAAREIAGIEAVDRLRVSLSSIPGTTISFREDA